MAKSDPLAWSAAATALVVVMAEMVAKLGCRRRAAAALLDGEGDGP